MAIKVAVIKSHERIRAICKEPHARRHGGQLVQWFITDKYGRLLLSSGKLSALQAYMNAHATSPHERVHLGGLYGSMSRSDSRTGGYYQNRWKVSWVPLEDAAHVLEKMRSDFERVVLVGPEGSYVKGG